MAARREQLAEAATDYVLEHGLVGLSLRPLADGLGTSDRMLLYHFGSKDDLVASMLRTSNDRSVAYVKALAPSPDVRQAVLDLWGAVTSSAIAPCSRLYVEASALGLLGREPYAAAVREFNELWMDTLAGHLVASGVQPAPARRLVELVDAAFMGFFLDMPLDDEGSQERAVADLAEAVALIAGGAGTPSGQRVRRRPGRNEETVVDQ